MSQRNRPVANAPQGTPTPSHRQAMGQRPPPPPLAGPGAAPLNRMPVNPQQLQFIQQQANQGPILPTPQKKWYGESFFELMLQNPGQPRSNKSVQIM